MTDASDADDVIETEHTFTLLTGDDQLERPEEPTHDDYKQIAGDSLLIPLINLSDDQELPDAYSRFEDVLAVSVVIVGREPDGTLAPRRSRALDPSIRAQDTIGAVQLLNQAIAEDAGFPIGVRDMIEKQGGMGFGIPFDPEQLAGSDDDSAGPGDPLGFM